MFFQRGRFPHHHAVVRLGAIKSIHERNSHLFRFCAFGNALLNWCQCCKAFAAGKNVELTITPLFPSNRLAQFDDDVLVIERVDVIRKHDGLVGPPKWKIAMTSCQMNSFVGIPTSQNRMRASKNDMRPKARFRATQSDIQLRRHRGSTTATLCSRLRCVCFK